jgi:hypothetical protein
LRIALSGPLSRAGRWPEAVLSPTYPRARASGHLVPQIRATGKTSGRIAHLGNTWRRLRLAPTSSVPIIGTAGLVQLESSLRVGFALAAQAQQTNCRLGRRSDLPLKSGLTLSRIGGGIVAGLSV